MKTHDRSRQLTDAELDLVSGGLKEINLTGRPTFLNDVLGSIWRIVDRIGHLPILGRL